MTATGLSDCQGLGDGPVSNLSHQSSLIQVKAWRNHLSKTGSGCHGLLRKARRWWWCPLCFGVNRGYGASVGSWGRWSYPRLWYDPYGGVGHGPVGNWVRGLLWLLAHIHSLFWCGFSGHFRKWICCYLIQWVMQHSLIWWLERCLWWWLRPGLHLDCFLCGARTPDHIFGRVVHVFRIF